jgi:hypothetical protein
LDNLFRGHPVCRSNILGNFKILTEAAGKIATHRPYRIGKTAWIKMIEWFLFNGIHTPGTHLLIDH